MEMMYDIHVHGSNIYVQKSELAKFVQLRIKSWDTRECHLNLHLSGTKETQGSTCKCDDTYNLAWKKNHLGPCWRFKGVRNNPAYLRNWHIGLLYAVPVHSQLNDFPSWSHLPLCKQGEKTQKSVMLQLFHSTLLIFAFSFGWQGLL